MSKRARRQFTQEFKDEAVRLVRTSGNTLPQVARDLDLTQSALRNWVAQAQPRSDSSQPSLSEHQELVQSIRP